MLRKVRITDRATPRPLGEQVEQVGVEAENERVDKMGGKPAEATPVLLGHHESLARNRIVPDRLRAPGHPRVLTEPQRVSRRGLSAGLQEKRDHGSHIPAGSGSIIPQVTLKPLVKSPKTKRLRRKNRWGGKSALKRD